MFKNNANNMIKKFIAVAFWVTVWFIVAFITDNKLLVASPVDTIKALISLVVDRRFYVAVVGSVLRVFGGLITGALLGITGAAVSYKYEWFSVITAPLVNMCKSVPVAVFSVILLIWWGPDYLGFIISLIVVFPIMYNNILEGLNNIDEKMTEMAKVFSMPFRNKMNYIYRPELKGQALGGMKSAVGMSWKAAVAAEVIGLANSSIGERLYTSKIYFDTAGVFAWAIVVVILSKICEDIVIKGLEVYFNIKPNCTEYMRESMGNGEISCKNMSKSYADIRLYSDYNRNFRGKENTLSTASGSGKTTLLRMIAGLEKADEGQVKAEGNVAMVFQEDRLSEEFSPLINVMMVGVNENVAKEALKMVLDEGDAQKPCRELSGGMKRRVAIVRAVEADADILLLDEPFTGMDKETVNRVKEYVERRSKAKTIITATHIKA